MHRVLQALPHVIRFYNTAHYPCSYLPEHEACSQVATPAQAVNSQICAALLAQGFRRSGQFVYRPACDNCQACIPVRLLVDAFSPDRSQLRAEKRHAHLDVHLSGLEYVSEHFALYQRYQAARHPDGGMDLDDQEQYENFILKSSVASLLVEFREHGILRMVSLIDQVENGVSSVYTFYEPNVPGTSYGTFNILWQAGYARRLGIPYLYLGYWIGACRKMAYKIRYQPLEGLVDGIWQSLRTTDSHDG